MAKGLEELLDEVPEDIVQEQELADFLPRGFLSVSAANLFLQCPRKYYLKYIEKKPTKIGLRMFEGVNIHEAAEKTLESKRQTGVTPKVDLALDAFSDAFEKSKEIIEDWDGVDPGQAKDNGIKITKVHHAKVAPVLVPVKVEKSFSVKIGVGEEAFPLVGRIDAITAKVDKTEGYDPEIVKKIPRIDQQVRDLKICADKWSENDLKNDLQFAVYASVEQIPDVAVDQLVKGRGKLPNPRYEYQSYVVTRRDSEHAIDIMKGVAKSIALGHFPMCAPDQWHCSEKWCDMWKYCRGKKT